MKVIILTTNLKKGLDAVSRGSLGAGANLPILKNVLLETNENKVKCSTTNLEIAITSTIPGKIVEQGGITIPFIVLNTIVNNLQADKIQLETKENVLELHTDNYHAKLQGIKKEEFPIIPTITNKNISFTFNTQSIKEALMSIINAAQISETKPELSGVYFDFQVNNIKLVATDSFRLAEKTLRETQFKTECEEKCSAIIPLRTIHEVIRTIKDNDQGEIVIYFDQNQIMITGESITIISRLISGNFPDYHAIIPSEVNTEAIIQKNNFIEGLKVISSLSDRFNEIEFTIKENTKNIELVSKNQTIGENQYFIPAKIQGEGQKLVFNWRFLLDGVKNITSEEFVLGVNHKNKPAILKSSQDTSYFYIVMPAKTGE